jgi:hypothetical protein
MRKVHNRQESSAIQDRDAQLMELANAWGKAQVRRFFEERKSSGEQYTPADVLNALDERADAPAAWLRWADQYNTRFAIVRNACVAMARRGVLTAGSTTNALGRDAACYALSGDVAEWAVVVSPPDKADRVLALVREWLEGNPAMFAGVTAITATRKDAVDVNDHHPGGVRGRAANR